MIRKAKAVWRGTGRAGSGNLSTDSGVLAETPYSFKTRFENEKGTNPEELIAAAHAGCFTMALAFGLQGAGYTPTELSTEAAVTLDPEGQGFRISRSALTLRGKVPNLDEATFARMAGDAEKNCPVSKVLNAEITLDAKLLWGVDQRGAIHLQAVPCFVGPPAAGARVDTNFVTLVVAPERDDLRSNRPTPTKSFIKETSMSSLFSNPKNPAAFSIRVEGMASDSCVERVEKAIRATPGVVSASVNLATNRAEVTFSGVPDIAAVIAAIGVAGYECMVENASSSNLT
jgi:osmotically inducible protein OsmC